MRQVLIPQAAAHLRVLITLFVTNAEFRKLIKDLGIIGRDVLRYRRR